MYTIGSGCPATCPPYHCDADAKAWVEKSCVGRESCSLDPIHALGDTCPSKHKKLAVQARCKSGTGASPSILAVYPWIMDYSGDTGVN